MKRTLLFIACLLASFTMQAQEGLNDYVPLVKNGKKWHTVRSESDENCHFVQYMLLDEGTVKAGKPYMKMYRSEDLLAVVYDEGLLREEDRRIYKYDIDRQTEFLVFDYSLNAGDTYETYSYEEQKDVSYKVLSVNYFVEGPEIVNHYYDEKADSMEAQRRYLRQWKVCRTDNHSCQKTWIEGIGSLEGPLANLYDSRPGSSREYLAYLECSNEDYLFLPFSFYTQFGFVHGSNLPVGEADYSGEGRHQLSYELEGSRLHVHGKAFTQCGPNNYVYFYERETDDPLVRKLEFVIQGVEPSADCTALHATDFYVPGFDPNVNYVVVSQGEEHPVVNRSPQMAYRPMVEDGKVWKLGFIDSGNPVQAVMYFYFDGDTIINGKSCRQMMSQLYYSQDFPDYDYVSQQPSLNYAGAWYEENKKVFTYDTTAKKFTLMYDFSPNANDTLLIMDNQYVIGPRQSGGLSGFKGVYREVRMFSVDGLMYSPMWLEGVGSMDGPTVNVYSGIVDRLLCLMSCTVGDEVVYLNDKLVDGASPEEARKQRFDFTHITKPKPKAPIRKAKEMSLYGEYNDRQLVLNLAPLDEAYMVRITDETGTTVYKKAVNAGNVVALSIDISSYAKDRYTVTVENGSESFTGVFVLQTTGIEVVRNNEAKEGRYYYNLQGQCISTLQKGLNIVNGQKVFVR